MKKQLLVFALLLMSAINLASQSKQDFIDIIKYSYVDLGEPVELDEILNNDFVTTDWDCEIDDDIIYVIAFITLFDSEEWIEVEFEINDDIYIESVETEDLLMMGDEALAFYENFIDELVYELINLI